MARVCFLMRAVFVGVTVPCVKENAPMKKTRWLLWVVVRMPFSCSVVRPYGTASH